MKELSGFDQRTFKHSICVAEVAASVYTIFMQGSTLPLEQLESDITTLSLGGYVHDIGKAGINMA